jgi:hypothetical protein
MTLQEEIRAVLNRHSAENISDTPDYILASFLTACLDAWNGSTVERDRWHGFRSSVGLSAGPLKKDEA